MATSPLSSASDAVREFFEAAPWRLVSEDRLFGVRDEEGARLACAAISGEEGDPPALYLALGAEGFRLLDEKRAGRIDPDDFMQEADLLVLVSFPRGEAGERHRGGIEIGSARGFPVSAYRKPPGLAGGRPSEADLSLLARALSTLARLAREDDLPCGAFPLEYPDFLVLLLGKDGERWTRERIEAPARRPLPPLEVPAEVRRAILGRPQANLYLASVRSIPVNVGDTIPRLFLLCDPREGQVLACKALEPATAAEEGAKALLRALAGRAEIGPGAPGRPRHILTDSPGLEDRARAALATLGIGITLVPDLPQLEAARASFLERYA
ncbi:MAG: hypothetical protein L0323_11305 [Planctomycetes bacterium]|nr:hypothetical protein [Planctomycetota bacterium]